MSTLLLRIRCLSRAAKAYGWFRLFLLHQRRWRDPGAFHSHDQGTKARAVDIERMLQLGEGLVVALDIHEHVVRLVHLAEGERELTPAQVLEPVDLAVLRGDRG